MAKAAQKSSENLECCPNCTHSQYLYHASAYGVAAEIERPIKQSIHSQAATVLPTGGGRGSERAEKVRVPPFVSFDAAYSEVGGSFDACHNIHTTYASAVIEGLNVFDVVTADRVVSRMVIYAYGRNGDEGEAGYDITGSHFDNLRIAGHPVDVKLPTSDIHKHENYSSFEAVIWSKQGQQFLPWGDKSAQEIKELEKQYHALSGLGNRASKWGEGKKPGQAYRAAAGGKPEMSNPGLTCFGNIVLVPKFGIVRLAELIIHRNFRYLTMFHVQMCSGALGGAGGGGAGGSGGMGYP
ncbi:MAG TPA: choice-of-anchor P family protein [Candidatus Angelobacter sp.]|nr:choice-of-anchor P family protein [Candidatus Angelobacter sp.]